jgi:hypothetical protein
MLGMCHLITRLIGVTTMDDTRRSLPEVRAEPPVDNRTVDNDLRLLTNMYVEVAPTIASGPWHWFAYHFKHGPAHPFVAGILKACADCERAVPGLGRQLLADLASISGMEKHLPHWDMLNQKLAEILVLQRLFVLPWPSRSPTFRHEPAGNTGGKRPELLVEDGGIRYAFEVKAPAILQHAINRGANQTQVPGRVFESTMLDHLKRDGPLTMPRDNPIKDFLISADAKFAPFKAQGTCQSVLVIVWDDHIYEPITSLTGASAKGILTPQSFATSAAGAPMAFPSVDAVILIRHLSYFIKAAHEEPLLERAHAFDFGDEAALPNVFIPVPGSGPIAEFITTGLRAVHFDDPHLRAAAEYNPSDLIFWLDMPPREK